MASESLLLVLIVREAGVRSSLAARLSMAGADVLTADDFSDPRLTRHQKRRRVLITDEAAVDGHAGGAAVLVADQRWLSLVVLSPGAPATSNDARLIRISRAEAATEIARLLPEWQAG